MENKISRTSTLIHPGSGFRIDTPLLIPSFSSKGNSDVKDMLVLLSEFITQSYLISAYDVYYDKIPKPKDLYRPSIFVLDSGGYEISKDRDLSDVSDPVPGKRDWNIDLLKSVMLDWPKEYTTILVSYDNPDEHLPFIDQVSRARTLFTGQSHHLRTFLLKPETKGPYTLATALKNAILNIGELRSFDVIGVTQKELGHSIIDQMVQIARFRRELDAAGIRAPIHVFGSLDPLTVCLFFISGAEIFDGLTWMRYSYRGDQCVYIDNAAVLEWGLHLGINRVRGQILRNNIVVLDTLTAKIREFQFTGDFEKLPHGKTIQAAVDSLKTRLGKGGAI